MFLFRYPLLSYTPKNQVYKYWMFIRKACFNLVSHSYFEWFILLLILASTICLVSKNFLFSSKHMSHSRFNELDKEIIGDSFLGRDHTVKISKAILQKEKFARKFVGLFFSFKVFHLEFKTKSPKQKIVLLEFNQVNKYSN